jgi:hypothetical protein
MIGQHTPGPWYAVGCMVEVGDDESADICTTNPDLFEQGHLAPPIKEQQANARLIAAAPDLARALADLLADAVEMGLDDSPVSGSLIAARAALQKAGAL